MTELKFPTVWNPLDHTIYVDNPYEKEPTYDTPLMNAKLFMQQLHGESKAANTVSLEDIFYNNDGKEELNFLDKANTYYDKILSARSASSRERNSKAAAVITSKDFTDFQNQLIIGQNVETAIRTGILASLFQTVAVPSLSGKWMSLANDLKYHRNIPETKSPEPSKGAGSVTTISVQKHGGAVAITQRAEAVINGDNPFQRLVNQMGQKKLFDENDMVADEIESNTANSITGVDFGIRSGTPPASTQNPIDLLTTFVTTYEALSQPVNLFVSKGFIYNEFILNDIIRGGINNAPPAVGNVDEQVGPFPLLGGVRWARDNAISSATAGWLMNDNAIKLFRGPSRNYTIADEDTETTKYVTKNYFLPETVDTTIIHRVTGVAA
jgi:hypothetical protein